MTWLEGLQQLSVLSGILVALYGIDSWRREHSGKRRLELAEDALALFYEAEDAIKHIRHPASFAHELKDIERLEGETDDEYKARKNASIVFVRYNQHRETFNKLHAMRYRFMAQLGKESSKPFDDLREIVESVKMAASWLARLWQRDQFRSELEWSAHRARIEKYEAVFWEGSGDPDPVQPKLDLVIAEIEQICGAVIRGQGTLFGLLNLRFWRSS